MPTFHITFSSVVTAVVGANFQATAQRGSRPTDAQPVLKGQVVDLHDRAVDLEIQLSPAPLPLQALVDHLLLAAQRGGYRR